MAHLRLFYSQLQQPLCAVTLSVTPTCPTFSASVEPILETVWWHVTEFGCRCHCYIRVRKFCVQIFFEVMDLGFYVGWCKTSTGLEGFSHQTLCLWDTRLVMWAEAHIQALTNVISNFIKPWFLGFCCDFLVVSVILVPCPSLSIGGCDDVATTSKVFILFFFCDQA